MHTKVYEFLCNEILRGLRQLPEEWQQMFRKMYGRARGRRSLEDALALPLEKVVAEVSVNDLETALAQTEASIAKLKKEGRWVEAPSPADRASQLEQALRKLCTASSDAIQGIVDEDGTCMDCGGPISPDDETAGHEDGCSALALILALREAEAALHVQAEAQPAS